MVRPIRERRIFFQPEVTYFKPAGVPLANLKETVLSFEELEAIRLIDLEKIGQEEAGKKMKISQSTLSRLLKKGREKLAGAVVNGNSIKIEGGNFKMNRPQRGGRFRAPLEGGRGRNKGLAAGPGGICKCPKCGYEQPQKRGNPCNKIRCPKCNTLMTRK